ncbi:hypothetical protein EXIGLDRAFT_844892 [Exidia glandulosa HHB12029]|uniref:glutathione transferase n=1 Tax=Exidia glandulosa HHB12029 TaxID=1314781 RepID=A0A165BRQ9_EXIGL|nr:hypothetical protein EXIGLDRAFT_844892 [Exidia glandulosa HHB12029]
MVSLSLSYEVHYFESAGRADLPRMMLDVAGAPYKNVFIDFAKWSEVKDTMAFGKVPKLVVSESDGSRKELFETNAIVNYLAEVLGLAPDGGAFARAKAASITSNLCDLEDKLRRTYGLPSVEERHKAHEKHIAETIPTYLKYHERLVEGDFYFGDKVTVADLKLHQMYCLFDDMYAARNPFKTHAAEFTNLNRIIATLAAGPAGEYARNRRDFGRLKWVAERWEWVFDGRSLDES